MFCPWNLCFVLSIALPLPRDAFAFAGEGDEETQRGSPKFGADPIDFRGLPLSWPVPPSEQLDGQGVIGEYDGSRESTETTVFQLDDKELIPSNPTSGSTEEATEDGRLTTTREQHVLSDESADFRSGSFRLSARTSEDQSASPAPNSEVGDRSQQHFPPPGPQVQSRGRATPEVATGHLGRTTDPSLNSQRQDALGQTEDTGESLHTGGAGGKLGDTGESCV